MATVHTAPWSDELVKQLNEDQHSNGVHPYTCGNCRDKLGVWFVRNKKTGEERRVSVCYKPTEDEEIFFNDRVLVATKDGWRCPTCDWDQNWCLEPSELWVKNT